MSTATSLPASDGPLIQDMDLARAVLAMKEGYLAKAPAKDRDRCSARLDSRIRRVHGSGYVGTYTVLLARYDSEMGAEAATWKGGRDDG